MDKPSAKIKQDAIDAMKYAFEQMNKPEPLLTIELQDETSVPKVFYKGEEIHLKTNIIFDWETTTADPSEGGLTYAIEHYEHGKVPTVLNRIERRVKGHATN